MGWLRTLWQETQHVLREMSVVQRVVVSLFLSTIALMLTFAVWLGAGKPESGPVPLPYEVDPTDHQGMIDALRTQGISAEYDFDSRRLRVPQEDTKKAMLHLVSNQLVKDPHAFGMEEMLKAWSFTDSRDKSREMSLVARGNTVASVLEMMEPVKSARVIFNDQARNSLFTGPYPITASVIIATKNNRPLSDDQAQAIIRFVAGAKAGLDPRGVNVTDQTGRNYEVHDERSPGSLGRRKWEMEAAYNEDIRPQLENIVSRFVGNNIQYGGAILVRPHHEIDASYVEIAHREILEGQATLTQTDKRDSSSTEKPAMEPGAKPNVLGNRQMSDNVLNGRVFESRASQKSTRRQIEPSVRERADKRQEITKNLTIAVVINLPFMLERDAEGQPIAEVAPDGRQLVDPEHGGPYYRRKSVEPFSETQVAELARTLARAAGNIKDEEIPEKISISQIPWQPPVMPLQPPETDLSKMLARAHMLVMPALMAALLLGALGFVWREARQHRSRPAAEEEVEEDEIIVALAPPATPEENADAEMENMRLRVQEAVLEDPARAALQLRRWMTREN